MRERWWRRVETLVTAADLRAWLQAAELLEPTASIPTSRQLRSARELREAIDLGIEAIGAGEPLPAASATAINAWLPAATLERELRVSPGESARLVSVPSRDPIGHALGRIAADAAEIFGTEERTRAKICASETCSARFFDRSPAGNRRWCSMGGCGNIAKARRHRNRAQEVRSPDQRRPDPAGGTATAAER